MVFLQLQFSESVQFWIYLVLIWIGFGFLVGLAARIIFPGEEPSGALGILVIGLLGYVMGRPDFLDIAILYTLINFVSTIAANRELAGAEIELVPVMSRELRLRKAIDEMWPSPVARRLMMKRSPPGGRSD